MSNSNRSISPSQEQVSLTPPLDIKVQMSIGNVDVAAYVVNQRVIQLKTQQRELKAKIDQTWSRLFEDAYDLAKQYEHSIKQLTFAKTDALFTAYESLHFGNYLKSLKESRVVRLDFTRAFSSVLSGHRTSYNKHIFNYFKEVNPDFLKDSKGVIRTYYDDVNHPQIDMAVWILSGLVIPRNNEFNFSKSFYDAKTLTAWDQTEIDQIDEIDTRLDLILGYYESNNRDYINFPLITINLLNFEGLDIQRNQIIALRFIFLDLVNLLNHYKKNETELANKDELEARVNVALTATVSQKNAALRNLLDGMTTQLNQSDKLLGS